MIESTGSSNLEITSASGAGIITLLDVAALNLEYAGANDLYYLGYSFFLEAMQVTVALSSLGKTAIPNIKPESTQPEKQAEIYRVQEQFPKIGLDIYKAIGSGGWKRQARVILQNPGSEWYLPLLTPYLTMAGQVKLLGKVDKIGVQVVNLGKGTLGTADKLTIDADWRQVITFQPKSVAINGPGGGVEIAEEIVTTSFGEDVTDQPTQILESNTLRRLLWIQNDGNTRVWFGFNNTAPIGETSFLDPGLTFNLDSKERVYGALYARTETGVGHLVGIEGTKA